jgi:predicted enzyme related to lactoylglutathione lyase
MSTRERQWPPGTPCWVDLTTQDIDGARTFYGAVLGWEFEISGAEYGGYTLCSRHGAAAAGIMQAMTPEQPAAWTLYLATADARATAAAVSSAGGSVLVPPMEIPDRGVMVGFTDPTGVFYGAWQPAPFIGAGIVNEPGSLVWEDLRSGDPDASRAFLTTVFGFAHDSGETLPDDYTTLRLGEPFPVGGVGPLFGAPAPHWLVYFGVADIDAALATAVQHGGQALRPVDETPFGRMTTLSDPSGAIFALIQTDGQGQPDRT